ncbi:MAG: hypothetical protein AXW12_13605 [Thalassospira sp. Nap_22]|nr:MAG: hypothetical protein AXW12_13605 [Thalassospira sp. Nap_22]
MENPPRTYETVSEAVKSEPSFFVEADDWKTFGVRITDPALSQGGSLNNFKVGRTTLDADQKYLIAVSSLCYECLGFRKKVMPFNAYLFDPDYIQIETIKGEMQGMAGGGGTVFVPTKAGDYYVLVAADNSRIAETFSGQIDLATSGVKGLEAMDGGGLMGYPVYPSPEGSMMLHVRTLVEE